MIWLVYPCQAVCLARGNRCAKRKIARGAVYSSYKIPDIVMGVRPNTNENRSHLICHMISEEGTQDDSSVILNTVWGLHSDSSNLLLNIPFSTALYPQ